MGNNELKNINFQYTLLENGLDFIYSAAKNIEEYNNNGNLNTEERKNLIKYAVLHLSSGIELIFKQLLISNNWIYVFADMNRATIENWKNGNFNSVDSKTAIERLKNLCDINIPNEEIVVINGLRNIRNKMEHLTIDINIMEVENIIRKCISSVISLVCKIEITQLSDNEKILIEKIKDLLCKMEVYYDDVVKLCDREIDSLRAEYVEDGNLMYCPRCLEKFLLRINNGKFNKCIFCGYEPTVNELVKCYVNDVIGVSEYEIMKNNDEWPVYECPNCDAEALVVCDDGNIRCLSCNKLWKATDFSSCDECGRLFLSKDGEIICGNCWSYKISKND